MRCIECGIQYGPGEVPIICKECRPGHPIDAKTPAL